MLADISNVDAIYIVCGRTDMRKSIDGLCAIIQDQFSMEIDHALYCKLRLNGMPVPLLRNGYSIFNGTKYR